MKRLKRENEYSTVSSGLKCLIAHDEHNVQYCFTHVRLNAHSFETKVLDIGKVAEVRQGHLITMT